MRVYNITTECKFQGMYLGEEDCGSFIYNVCLASKLCDIANIQTVANHVLIKLHELIHMDVPVMITLATVQHGNKNCVRVTAIGAILSETLGISNEDVLKVMHDSIEEWEDVEIAIGEVN